MLDLLTAKGFEVMALHHAEAIIRHDMAEAAGDLERVLDALVIPVTELVGGGGGETQGTQRLRRALSERGWSKRNVTVRKYVKWGDDQPEQAVASLSHEIDHVKVFGPDPVFALEIEWNNKDPFFDRDLETFKRLHAEGAISVGGIVTRGTSLQANARTLLRRFADEQGIDAIEALDAFGYNPTRRQRAMIAERARRSGDFRQAWVDVFCSDKFGEATTHWRKLQDRVLRGVGNPCPLVLIGIPDCVVSFAAPYPAAEL